MWMSDPMPVTTRIINAASGSTRSANGTSSSPDLSHVKTVCSTTAPPEKTGHAEATATRKAPIIAAHARPPDRDLDRRLPRKALIAKPANGNSGISSSIDVSAGAVRETPPTISTP